MKDDLEMAAQWTELATTEGGEEDVLMTMLPTDDALKRCQSKEAQGKGTLARARLTNNPQCHALTYGQANIIHSIQLADMLPEQSLPCLLHRKGTRESLDADKCPAAYDWYLVLLWHGLQQPAGVLFLRRSKDCLSAPLLNNPALVHN